MVRPPDDALQVIRPHPPDPVRGEVWLRALLRAFDGSEPELIKDAGRVSVWSARPVGEEVVVKCWDLRPLRRRVQALEVPTATTIAIVRGRRGRARVECLIMGRVPGMTVLDVIAQGRAVRAEHALAERLGKQAARLGKMGAFNRDHKPSNLVVRVAERPAMRLANEAPAAAAEEIVLVDCAGVRACRGRDRGLARMLAALVIEPTGCGCPPRRALMWRCVLAAVGSERRRARQVWLAVAEIVRRHGDPSPRVNPLGTSRVSAGEARKGVGM
jgi:hypothetical protein